MKKYLIILIVMAISISCSSSEKPKKVTKVYTNEQENTIYFDTNKTKMNILDKDVNSVFQIIETTEDNQWVIVIIMPAEAPEGHVETIYSLYNTFKKVKIDQSILKGHDLLGFEKSGDDTFVLTESDQKFSLKELYKKLDKK